MGRGAMIGRGLIRSGGQVAMSVVATLIATQIYAALQRGAEPAAPAPRPSVTSGGKFDARLAGAALPPVAEPARPALSIVDWAITPQNPAASVQDIAWGPLDGSVAPSAPLAPKPVHRDIRRSVVAATGPAQKPVSLPQLDLHTTPAAPERDGGLWSMAAGTARGLVAFGGSAVALGGSALGRLLP